MASTEIQIIEKMGLAKSYSRLQQGKKKDAKMKV
jgi:hypothetical protein